MVLRIQKFFFSLLILTILGCSIEGTSLNIIDENRSFGPPLNTQNVEYNPVISPNGYYLVFQSNRPGGKGGMDIWVSTNKNYPNRMKFPEWLPPENFEELNTPGFEGMFSIFFNTEDDKPEEVFFTSERLPGREGYEGLNIYYTNRIPGSKNWKKPIHLDTINSNYDDKMPAISPDGKILVFSSDRPGGYGGLDLWISFRESRDQDWSEPINMGPVVNSNYNEIAPSFHWDGETLYFSSDREDIHKKFRFFLTNLKEETQCRKLSYPYNPNCWEPVTELGYPFNTQFFQPETSVGAFDRYDPRIPLLDYRASDNEYISITKDDLWVYFASNRPGGQGQFDIYRAPMPSNLRKSYDFLFHGLVLDGSEEKMIGIDATIQIQDNASPIKVLTSARIGGNLEPEKPGEKVENFRTTLKTGKLYRVTVSSPGFYPTELTLDLRGNIGRNQSRYETIVLQKIKPPPPISQAMVFGIYDKKTKEPVLNSQIVIFTTNDRRGRLVEGDKNIFRLESYPEEDFEVFVRAEGYKDDTFFFKSADIPALLEKETKLYITNLKDLDPVYSTIIYFPFNVAQISKEDQEKLDLLSEYLKKNPSDIIEIGGHTDNIGSKEYNIELSQKRANSVANYLLQKGIPKNRMVIRAYYYSQPIADNSTEEGRAKNRRVNFKKLND